MTKVQRDHSPVICDTHAIQHVQSGKAFYDFASVSRHISATVCGSINR